MPGNAQAKPFSPSAAHVALMQRSAPTQVRSAPHPPSAVHVTAVDASEMQRLDPLLHMPPAGHWLPQPPQFSASAQMLMQLSPQQRPYCPSLKQVSPAVPGNVQSLVRHSPSPQLSCAAQSSKQRPQWSSLACVFTHSEPQQVLMPPSAVRQYVELPLQDSVRHSPAAQRSAPWQETPQAPQLGLSRRDTQTPPQHRP